MKAKTAVRPALSTVFSKAQRAFYERAADPPSVPGAGASSPGAGGSGRDAAPAAGTPSARPKRKQGLARLMELAGRKRGLLVGAVALAVAASAARFSPFILVYFMMDQVVMHFHDLASIDWRFMAALAAGALAAAAVYGVAMYLSTMLAHTAAFNILYEVRVQLMGKLARVPSGFFSDVRQGEVKKVMSADVEQIEGFVAHHLADAASAASLPLVAIACLLAVDWRLALALVIPIVAAFILMGRALATPEGAACQAAMRASGETLEGTTVEYVHGMSVVKVFNRSLSAFRRFEADAREYVGNIKWATYFNASGMGRMYAAIGAQMLCLLVAVLLVLPGVSADGQSYARFVSTVLLFFLVGAGMKEPVLQMITQTVTMSGVNAAVERIDEILDYPDLAEPAEPREPQDASVEFSHVSFSYAGPDGPRALDDVSFRLPSGSVTGLVGPSGGGKSTIAALILRFFDADEGSVRVGGVDVRELSSQRLSDTVSFVFQDTFLLADTLEANIRMGNEAATRDEVLAAARAACIDDVVARLPEGLDTRIGPGGTYLSGGEAQRVAIARVFLKDAPIVVLDEATAYADAENEGRIQQAFARLARDKTVLIIAHRLKTVEAADRILVMDEGRLAAQGPHDALVRKSALYRRMVEANERRDAWDMAAGKEDRRG